LRDRRRHGLLAATLFLVAILCILSRMKTFSDRLGSALANFAQPAGSLDVLLMLGLLAVGVAGAVTALALLLRRADRFRFAALTITVALSVILCLREVQKVLRPPKGIELRGWQQIRSFIDSMDYHYLVFVGEGGTPTVHYYLNGLNLNWHPYIVFAALPEYDEARLAQFVSGDDARFVVMRPWIEEHWTADQRERLLGRLEKLAGGHAVAIYRVKPR